MFKPIALLLGILFKTAESSNIVNSRFYQYIGQSREHDLPLSSATREELRSAMNHKACDTVDVPTNQVEFRMYHSHGDGWHGNWYDVSLDGVLVATGALRYTQNGFGKDILHLVPGCYDVFVSGAGDATYKAISFDFGDLSGKGYGSYTGVSVGGAEC